MNNRPDIDEDVRRLLERAPVDDLGILRLCTLSEPEERRRVLADFASSSLRTAIRSDIGELRTRGIRAVPLCHGQDSATVVLSADKTRKVEWTYILQNSDFDVHFYYTDRQHETCCATVRLPFSGTTDYTQLPTQVRQCADQVRVFLLHGERPEN